MQPDEPVTELLSAAGVAAPGWLRRVTLQAAGSPPPPGLNEAVEEMVAVQSVRLRGELEALLRTDVDEQRTNPLSLFRSAVDAPTRLLQRFEIAPPPPDAFAGERFPDDPYRLGPATWSDIDPALHEPGLTWGAWKALTVLRRRRHEGLR